MQPYLCVVKVIRSKVTAKTAEQIVTGFAFEDPRKRYMPSKAVLKCRGV
jgi:hypothetical protein